MDAVVIDAGPLGLFQQSQAGRGSELARDARAFDQPTPPLMTAVTVGDLTPAGKRAIRCPVGQCPLPRLPLKIPNRTMMGNLPFLGAHVGGSLPLFSGGVSTLRHR
jgi:hypothetical protein